MIRAFRLIPDPVMGNASKNYAATHIYEAARLATDMVGGLVATIPSWKDFRNPETRGYLEKYLRGAAGVPVEDRAKMFKLVQTSICMSSMCPNVVLGAGTSYMSTIGLHHNVDLQRNTKLAQAVVGIKDSLSPEVYISDLVPLPHV